MLIGKFAGGDKAKHPLKPNRHAWLQVAEGNVKLNGTTLNAGDGAAVTEESVLNLESTGPAQIVLFDLN